MNHNQKAQILKELQDYLSKNKVDIGFSVSEGSDTHGLYDEKIELILPDKSTITIGDGFYVEEYLIEEEIQKHSLEARKIKIPYNGKEYRVILHLEDRSCTLGYWLLTTYNGPYALIGISQDKSIVTAFNALVDVLPTVPEEDLWDYCLKSEDPYTEFYDKEDFNAFIKREARLPTLKLSCHRQNNASGTGVVHLGESSILGQYNHKYHKGTLKNG